MDREMMKALEADGEKLRQQTGQDHGPVFLDCCPQCGGAGSWEEPCPQHDDPYYCVVRKCENCSGDGMVEVEAPPAVSQDERDEYCESDPNQQTIERTMK